MKKSHSILFFVLIFISVFKIGKSQILEPSKYIKIDSTEFSQTHPLIFIHPRPDNLWQYCTPDKPFFNTSGYAMVTDSINNYSVPDTSIFELRYKENYPMMSYYIEITHKYDFDVYNAGGFISFSLDSGKTWGSIDNYLNNINAFCTEYAQFFASNSYLKSDSLTDGTPCFTGTTTEWKKTFLEFIFYLPVKTEPVDCYNIRTVWTRFTFVSLPTAQQENGWAIKKLK